MARGRGGNQPPRRPAPVSGPGAMSRRTDGGVPQMTYTGEKYGENQAVNEQQSAAPMSQAAPGGGGPPSPRPVAQGPAGIFGPSERPGEPLTAGIPWGPGGEGAHGPVLDDNPDLFLQALAAKYPHPDLIDLINRRRS